MNTFKIYGDLNSGNCLKIKYVADYLGLPYEWIHIDIKKGETKNPDFLKLNPAGQIPVVQLSNGQNLAQSNSIIKFLARGSLLVPEDPFEYAKVDEWLFWEQYSHEPAIAVLRYKVVYLGMNHSQVDPQLIHKSHAALKVMNNHLEHHTFLVSERFTVADVALLAYTRLAPQALLDLKDYPHVTKWIAKCEETLGLN